MNKESNQREKVVSLKEYQDKKKEKRLEDARRLAVKVASQIDW